MASPTPRAVWKMLMRHRTPRIVRDMSNERRSKNTGHCSSPMSERAISASERYRRPVWGFYLQDTWKITRKITLDYGLRYDLQPVQHEEYDRTASFDQIGRANV